MILKFWIIIDVSTIILTKMSSLFFYKFVKMQVMIMRQIMLFHTEPESLTCPETRPPPSSQGQRLWSPPSIGLMYTLPTLKRVAHNHNHPLVPTPPSVPSDLETHTRNLLHPQPPLHRRCHERRIPHYHIRRCRLFFGGQQWEAMTFVYSIQHN